MLFSTVPQLLCKPGARHAVGEMMASLAKARGAVTGIIGIITDPGIAKVRSYHAAARLCPWHLTSSHSRCKKTPLRALRVL